MEKETSRLSENLGKYSGRCLGAGRPISQKPTFEQVSERGILVLQVDHRRKSLLVTSQWYERAGRWQAGVRCGRGLAVSSKDGHLGWGQIAKYEYPAKTLGLYSVSREWVKRSMLDSVGEDTWSRGWGEPGRQAGWFSSFRNSISRQFCLEIVYVPNLLFVKMEMGK